MNITVFYSSGRGARSVTYNTARLLIDVLRKDGEVFEFLLPRDMPHVCVGCRACIDKDEKLCGGYKCMEPIIAAMEKSELIIFCAPVYAYHAPGQMKTLLDHFAYRWLVHRPDLSLMKKQAVIVSTAAGGGIKSTVRDIRDSLENWGVARTYSVTQGIWGYDWQNIPDRFRKRIEHKVEKVTAKIKRREQCITPAVKVRLLFCVYRFLHKNRKMTELDDEYWYKKNYITSKK